VLLRDHGRFDGCGQIACDLLDGVVLTAVGYADQFVLRLREAQKVGFAQRFRRHHVDDDSDKNHHHENTADNQQQFERKTVFAASEPFDRLGLIGIQNELIGVAGRCARRTLVL